MIKETLNKQGQAALSADAVLQDLQNGNARFRSAQMQSRDYNAQRTSTIAGQFPKAVVLSCIDSRVPVETIFDQGIGDLFVARVAGNFENTDILGSMEYSCKVAGSKLILVMGHESCGAVKAACDGVTLGNITPMLENIMPAVHHAAEEVEGEANSSNAAFVSKSIVNNVKLTIERIREKSPILKEMEEQGEIKIIGGVYSLSDGEVKLL
jgi:carbonic anhydrase